MPTKPAAPVTRTEKPDWERIRAEDLTRFSQAGPPQELVRRDLRERSEGIGEEDEGDLKKKTKIKPKKIKDQNVSLAKDECHLNNLWRMYGDFSILNLPGVDGMLSMWGDICFISFPLTKQNQDS